MNAEKSSRSRPPNARRKILFRVILLGMGGLLGIGLAEISLALLAPQETLSPRYMFSREYGVRPFPEVTMVHERKGHFHFEYRTNRLGFRGKDVPISNRYPTENLVLLGDSRSFGFGVNDGQNYATLLEEKLDGRVQVVNLGCPSWGLTQQIRCYYEFGQLYKPRFVLLQTNANDVEDNQINKVTTVHDGRFVFTDSGNSANWVKRYLSRSLLQKSHLYNLVRDDVYRLFTQRSVGLPEQTERVQHQPEDAQRFYNELLSAFAADLRSSGVELILFTHDIDFHESPLVAAHIREMAEAEQLRHCRLDPWLEGQQDYGSPEGHLLGISGHAIAAQGLAEFLRSSAELLTRPE